MIRAGAKFSTNRRYRYALWRPVPAVCEVSQRACVFIGCNPSTADETVDDPTIRRCSGFALREGCGILVMLNLFAFVSTDPTALRTLPRDVIVGPGNDRALLHYCTRTPIEPLVITAWGAHGGLFRRDEEVDDLLRAWGVEAMQLGRSTLAGRPRHPLYLAADTPLVPHCPSTDEDTLG